MPHPLSLATPLLALALALLLPAPALAANPCGADIEKLCKDVPTGKGRIAKCLEAHEAEVSPACKQWVRANKERAKVFLQACGPDIEKRCKGIRPGKGLILGCLQVAPQDELSAACRAQLH